jgi:hypothetical protein
MNGRSQMQGVQNRIFPKEINANWFFQDSNSLEMWKNHLCPSCMGPNGGSVAMDSGFRVSIHFCQILIQALQKKGSKGSKTACFKKLANYL